MPVRYALIPVLALGAACASPPSPSEPGATVFVGARLIDGMGGAPIEDAVLIVRDGRIEAVGPASSLPVPEDATRVDLTGQTVMPGLVNAHGHVTAVRGLEARPEHDTPEHVTDQLGLYARYGVTTVFSLGGDGAAGVAVRDRQRQDGPPDAARFFLAGPVVTATDPDEARRAVDELAAMEVDLVKIRVDDNLGAGTKMPPAAYRAVIDQAHRHGLRVAAHIFYLEDAKAVVDAGADLIAHSVRDAPVDEAFVDLLRARDVCVSPTLMREVSTFVYESRPAFFDDPFFLAEVDQATIETLESPAYQEAIRSSAAAQQYKAGLEVANANLVRLAEAGIRIAFGTDTGPPARFQGYFEHLELERMVEAGLTPMQAIVAATGDAARCMAVDDRLGTLTLGREADFLVLDDNPLDDIRHTRTLDSVWIGARRVN